MSTLQVPKKPLPGFDMGGLVEDLGGSLSQLSPGVPQPAAPASEAARGLARELLLESG